MMRCVRCTAAGVFALLIAVTIGKGQSASATSIAATASDTSADAAAVAALSARWAKLWSAKDLDGTVALYAEDAVFCPSTGTRVAGRDRIRALFAEALAVVTPSLTVRSTRAEVSGDLACDIGEYEETIVANGKTHTGRGSYLLVARRDAASRWLIVAQMWTDVPVAGK